MTRSEVLTVTATDQAGHQTSKAVTLNWTDGFTVGVTVGANEARWLATHPSGGTPASLQFAYNLVRPALGRDLGSHVKFFGDSGIADAANMRAACPVEPFPLLTNQVYDLPALNAWMSTLTAPAAYCYMQEFMDSISNWALYNQQLAATDAAIKAHPNGHFVQPQLVGNEASLRKDPTVWQNVTVPAGWRMGCDTYITQAQHLDVTKAFAGSVAWFNARKADTPGVHLAISEAGISRVNFTPAQRVKWLSDAKAYLKTVDPQGWFTYWATDNSNKDPVKDWSVDKPGDQAVAAELASLIT